MPGRPESAHGSCTLYWVVHRRGSGGNRRGVPRLALAPRRGALFVGILGAAILVVYGVIPTLQKSDDFGRIYAAYGGVFVIASLLWGWGVDKKPPDRFDWAGAAVVLAGVAIIYFAPRR